MEYHQTFFPNLILMYSTLVDQNKCTVYIQMQMHP